MPVIAYPPLLPGPTAWTQTPRERAVRSAPGFPHARRRWADKIADAQAAWVYVPSEMAIWRPFFHDTLIDGQLWFTAPRLPGEGGYQSRVVRYRPSTLQINPVGGGICRISVDLEVRGRSLEPA